MLELSCTSIHKIRIHIQNITEAYLNLINMYKILQTATVKTTEEQRKHLVLASLITYGRPSLSGLQFFLSFSINRYNFNPDKCRQVFMHDFVSAN